MKNVKQIFVIIFMLAFILSISSINAFAATVTQDNLEVTLVTDKEKYSENEQIKTTLTVKNNNDTAVTNVDLETALPDGYKLADKSENKKTVDSIAAGESVSLDVTLEKDSTKKDSTPSELPTDSKSSTNPVRGGNSGSSGTTTGGNSNNSVTTTGEITTNGSAVQTGQGLLISGIIILVLLTAGVVFIFVYRKKKSFKQSGSKMLSILLCIGIVGSTSTLITVKANAAEDSKTIRIETSVMVNGKLMNIEGSVKYQYSTNDNSGTQNSTNVIYSPNPENIVTDTTEGISFVNNMVIIVFSDTANNLDINNVIESINGKVVGKIDTINQYQVQIAEKSLDELKKTIEIIEKNDCVLFAHYDQAYQNIECATSVDDPWDGDVDGNDWLDADVDGSNWWLETIEAPAAWDYNSYFKKVKIGIVDNGFDTGHEDLNVSFPEDFNRLNSKEDHGSHVAGIIGATANNGKGITGIVWNKDLICFDWSPNWWQEMLLNWSTDTMIYAGLIFNVEAGAKVVNFSLGCAGNYPNGNTYSQNVIDNSGKEASGYMAVLLKNYDFIVVQAAGNGGVDAINALHFASITPNNCVNWGRGRANRQNILDRILIVAAVEQSTQSQTGYMVSSFSDGGNQVNIAAPGGDNSRNNDRDIYSTVTGGFKGKYKSMAGTSMAAPMVTGVAALVWSVNLEDFDGSEVASIVRDSNSLRAIDNPNSRGATGDFNIVNAKLSVEEAIRRCRTGTLSGKICKASDRSTPVFGATISIFKDGNFYTSKKSDPNGNYSINLPEGQYYVEIKAVGYIDFHSYATVTNDENTYMETFLMVEGIEGNKGTARGKVINSLTNVGTDGVNLTIRKDWNNTNNDAETIGSTTTSSGGTYSIELPLGNYTVVASKDGYLTSTFNIIVQSGTTGNQNGTITPIVDGDEYLITLTWGENPRDLDSHVEGTLSSGSSFHVYYPSSNMNQYDGDIKVCSLDYDDTTSYGPEHITLKPTTNDPYYYYIHKYAGSGTVASSGAKITVHKGNQLIATYNVPTNLGSDDYWNVFAIKNGQIINKNTITSSADTSYAR